jgi:hypothetical protein
MVGRGRLDGDGDVLDAGAFHQIQDEHHRAVRGVLRAGDINRQVRVQAVTVRQQREQFGEGNRFLSSTETWPSRFTSQVHDVRLRRAGGERGRGQVRLDRADNLHLQLIIMNDASRKNMMSISGMISSRDFFSGMGVRIFMAVGRMPASLRQPVIGAHGFICIWPIFAFGHERDFLDARARTVSYTFTMSPCSVSRSPLI